MPFSHSPPARGSSVLNVLTPTFSITWAAAPRVGPVPATESWEDLSRIRESFWKTPTPLARLSEGDRKRAVEKAGARQVPAATYELAQRDEQIRRLDDSSELGLWSPANPPGTVM